MGRASGLSCPAGAYADVSGASRPILVKERVAIATDLTAIRVTLRAGRNDPVRAGADVLQA